MSTCGSTFAMNSQGTLPAVSIAVLIPRLMRLGEQRGGEIRLQQAFAAAQRDAAAGLAIEGAVLLDLLQHFVDAHPLAEQIERLGRAQARRFPRRTRSQGPS